VLGFFEPIICIWASETALRNEAQKTNKLLVKMVKKGKAISTPEWWEAPWSLYKPTLHLALCLVKVSPEWPLFISTEK